MSRTLHSSHETEAEGGREGARGEERNGKIALNVNVNADVTLYLVVGDDLNMLARCNTRRMLQWP